MADDSMMNEAPTQADQLAIIQANGCRREKILNILLALQDIHEQRYVDGPTIALVAEQLHTTETRVFEIASFYSMIKTQPQARHTFQVCDSTPCYFCGSEKIAEWLEQELGVKAGDITADGQFSFERTTCVGACDAGPVVKVGDAVHGDLTESSLRALVHDLRNGVAK